MRPAHAVATLDHQLADLFQALLDEPTPRHFLDLVDQLEIKHAAQA